MDIEILENFRHERDEYKTGDIRRDVDGELGAYFCKCGWAKDIDGAVATGARDTREVILAPDTANHATKPTEV